MVKAARQTSKVSSMEGARPPSKMTGLGCCVRHKAIARDTDNYESDWSTLPISISRSKILRNIFLKWFFERLPIINILLYQWSM